MDSLGVGVVIESELPDLAAVPLADLPRLDERLIAPTLDRVLRRADDPETIRAGYNPQRLD